MSQAVTLRNGRLVDPVAGTVRDGAIACRDADPSRVRTAARARDAVVPSASSCPRGRSRC